MDPAILPAISGLIGSLIGGASTFAASWHTQRRQLRMHMLVLWASQLSHLLRRKIKMECQQVVLLCHLIDTDVPAIAS